MTYDAASDNQFGCSTTETPRSRIYYLGAGASVYVCVTD